MKQLCDMAGGPVVEKLTFSPPIQFKQFVHEQAARWGVSTSAIYNACSHGKYRLGLHRKNARVLLVFSAAMTRPVMRCPVPAAGEQRRTDFLAAEARRLGKTFSCVSMRLARGKYEGALAVRRVGRWVFVKRIEN